jgi:hypothetical protein
MQQGFGERLATVRRWLAVVRGEDVTQEKAAGFVDVRGATWSRWESGKLQMPRDRVQVLARICQQHGLTWVTAAWLDYEEGSGPPTVGHMPPAKRGHREGLRGEPLPRPALNKKRRAG